MLDSADVGEDMVVVKLGAFGCWNYANFGFLVTGKYPTISTVPRFPTTSMLATAIVTSSECARLNWLINDRPHGSEMGGNRWPNRFIRGNHLLGINTHLLVGWNLLVQQGMLPTSAAMLARSWPDVCRVLAVISVMVRSRALE